jgi:hypothetical protein
MGAQESAAAAGASPAPEASASAGGSSYDYSNTVIVPNQQVAMALDAASGSLDGQFGGFQVVVSKQGTEGSSTSSSSDNTMIAANQSEALALDAADGVIDGKCFGTQVAISSQTKANGNTLPATLGNTFGGYPSLTPVSGFGAPSVPALGYSGFSAPRQPTFTSFGAPPCHGFNAPSIFGQPFPSAFGSVAPTAYGGVAPTAPGQGARVVFGAAAGSFGGGVPRAQFIGDGGVIVVPSQDAARALDAADPSAQGKFYGSTVMVAAQ